MHGQEYDPNKRIKRVAAKAAQKIIDQIKTDFCLDESEDEDAEKDREFDDSKEELSAVDEEQAVRAVCCKNWVVKSYEYLCLINLFGLII